ncbi:MAG: hypothetical protein JKY08_03130 [Flavobacteriaceae bacterium]|nr:hypothetical protein [Flavobacteriaceae bacterium]
MKSLLFLVILCISITSFSQEITDTEKEISITTYALTFSDLEDFKTINWDLIPEILQHNQPETIVRLEFSIKTAPNEIQDVGFIDFKLVVQGKSKEVKSLVKRAKRILTKTMSLLRKKHN